MGHFRRVWLPSRIAYRRLADHQKMNLQLQLLGDVPVPRLVDRARIAEANGYSAVWLADERFYREVYTCLGQIAAHTTKVLVGPSVTDPYSRHPALTAMAIATLDEISGGRAILGIGAGISGFAELQIDRRKPARAMREAIAVIRALLGGETVDFRGEVVALNRGRLSFPALRALVPIYVASNGPVGQQMAAETADGIIMQACASVEEVHAFRAAVEDSADRAGRDPQDIRVIARLKHLHNHRRPRCARRSASFSRPLSRCRLSYLRTVASQGLALPPEEVARVAGAPYSAGMAPYLPLLPLITDWHVDALTLAGTVEEVTEHAVALCEAGVELDHCAASRTQRRYDRRDNPQTWC